MEEDKQLLEEKTVEDGPKKDSLRVKVLIGLCISVLVSFVPFTGYAYLKGYLIGLGFDSPVISPSIYDLVFYFLVGASKVINQAVYSLFSVDTWLFLGRIFLIYICIYFFVVLAIKTIRNIELSEPSFDLGAWIKDRLILSTESIKSFFVNAIILPSLPIACLIVLLAMLWLVLLIPWWIGALGILVGQAEGVKQFEKNVCKDIDWSEIPDDSNKLKSCTRIYRKNGEPLIGHKMYETKDRIYFITNGGAYELNQDMEVISLKEYINRPGEKGMQ